MWLWYDWQAAAVADEHGHLVDEDRDIPVMEEAHIVTSGPWAKTLRSEERASEASK